MGQGIRGRPGHADPGRARRAAAGPAARAGGRLPGRGARGRDGRRVRLLPARQGRGGAVDRHRDARARRGRRTSTTCTRTPGSRWPPRPTGRSSPRTCFGDRVVWVPWRRPGFQLGLDIAAMAAANPQAIGVVLGGHGITAWGATSEEAQANSLEIIAGAQAYLDEHGVAEPFGAVVPGNEPLPEAERRAKAAAHLPDDPRAGVHRSGPGGPLHRQRRGAGVPRPREARAARRAGHVLPGPLPAHQGQAAGGGPARGRVASRRSWLGCGELHAAYRDGLPRLLRAARRPGLAADARRRPGHRARARRRACSRSGATSRPPGWRASSTSTRST